MIYEHKILELEPNWISWAWRYFSDEKDVEDVVQDLVLKLLERKEHYKDEPVERLRNLGYASIKNAFINGYRKNKKYPISKYKAEEYIGLRDKDRTESRVYCRDIKEIVNRLSPKNKIVIQMRMLGFSYEEIAEKLNHPIGTVKARIHYARKILDYVTT